MCGAWMPVSEAKSGRGALFQEAQRVQRHRVAGPEQAAQLLPPRPLEQRAAQDPGPHCTAYFSSHLTHGQCDVNERNRQHLMVCRLERASAMFISSRNLKKVWAISWIRLKTGEHLHKHFMQHACRTCSRAC